MECEPWVTAEELPCYETVPDGWLGDLASWQAELAVWLTLANDILRVVSGFGVCQITEAACRRGSAVCGCPATATACRSCSHDAALELRGPVVEIVAVTLNGSPVDVEELEIVDGRWLYRRSGGWPDLLDPHVPTVTVTYRFGIEPDFLAIRALSDLACQWALPRSGCTPPANVVEVSRRGVRWRFADPSTGMSRLMSGLGVPFVDMWIAAQVAAFQKSAEGWELATPGSDPDSISWYQVGTP